MIARMAGRRIENLVLSIETLRRKPTGIQNLVLSIKTSRRKIAAGA